MKVIIDFIVNVSIGLVIAIIARTLNVIINGLIFKKSINYKRIIDYKNIILAIIIFTLYMYGDGIPFIRNVNFRIFSFTFFIGSLTGEHDLKRLFAKDRLY